MKISQQHILQIRDGTKQRVYRSYDDSTQKIKIGDTLLLISNSTNYEHVKVYIRDFKIYENWQDVIKKYWSEDFSPFNERYESIVRKLKNKYKNDKIVVYDIKLDKFQFKESRVLLDTNTIIYRESHNNVSFEVAELYKWFDKLNMRKLIHPKTRDEIEKYKDENLKNALLTKLIAYEEITPNIEYVPEIEEVVKKYSRDDNSKVDNSLIQQMHFGIADILVTNDRLILKKAEELYLRNRIFSADELLKMLEDEFPELINYKMLAVRLKQFGCIDLSNPFFDSLKEDYPEFERWFIKKNTEKAYIFEENSDILGFLYLKTEDVDENYSDILPVFSPMKRLKVGTFKINRSGFRLGERFLKIIFDNAILRNVDEIYVTLFEDKRDEVIHLMNFMSEWGFVKHGYKQSNGELVMVKSMVNYNKDKSPKYNFPINKKSREYYFLPIEPDYHTDLFPDSILKNENMNLYEKNLAHRYSLEKVYISGAKSNYVKAKPGDVIVIYRKGDRWPKKYSSVITGMAILEDIIYPKNLEEFILLCKDKSVFKAEELRYFYEEKTWSTVVKLLNLKSFSKKVTLNDLYEMKIINEGGPRPFQQIADEQFELILDRAGEKMK